MNGGFVTEALTYIEHGKLEPIEKPRLDPPFIIHRLPLKEREEAYCLFENKHDRVIRIAITPS